MPEGGAIFAWIYDTDNENWVKAKSASDGTLQISDPEPGGEPNGSRRFSLDL